MNGFPAEEFGESPLWSCPPKNDVFHQEAFAKPWLCSKEKLIGMRRLGLGTLVKSMVDDPADCDKFAFKESWHSVFVIKKWPHHPLRHTRVMPCAGHREL